MVRLPKIDRKELREMSRLVIPLFFVLVIQTLFDDWFSGLDEVSKVLVLLALVFGMAFAYGKTVKRWAT